MANIKDIYIEGIIPFDAGGSGTLLRFFGQCSLPIFGLTIQIEKKGFYIDNEFGGRTLMHRFVISGQEAIQFGFLDTICKEISRIGSVDRYQAEDIEEGR